MPKQTLKFLKFSIFRALDLKKPIFKSTTAYGHFGREGFSWENPKQLDIPDDVSTINYYI